MKRRVQKKRASRRHWEQRRTFRRWNDAHDRATFKARHGHWPGEYASPHIGHISGFSWFHNPHR